MIVALLQYGVVLEPQWRDHEAGVSDERWSLAIALVVKEAYVHFGSSDSLRR